MDDKTLNNDKAPCMRYIQKEFFGIEMKSEMKPYKKVVNNGYTIMTRDESLIHDLAWNEIHHNGIIDWFLFRQGKTILISTNGKAYGCTLFAHNAVVELNEIINLDFLEALKHELQ